MIVQSQTSVLPFPLKILVHTQKWVPNIIPLDRVWDVFNAFEQLPKINRLQGKRDNKWPEFIQRRNQGIFLTSFYLALRPGEAVNIRRSDVFQAQDGSLMIKIRGENNKRDKDRMLPVPHELTLFLTTMFKDFKYQDFWKSSEWLFPSYMDRSKPISRYQWNDTFQCALKQARLWRQHPTKKRGLYTAYSLRHTRAVDLLEKSNFDLWMVANVLGHGRLDVTTCYLPLCPTIQRHMSRVMNLSCFGNTKSFVASAKQKTTKHDITAQQDIH